MPPCHLIPANNAAACRVEESNEILEAPKRGKITIIYLLKVKVNHPKLAEYYFQLFLSVNTLTMDAVGLLSGTEGRRSYPAIDRETQLCD